MVAQLGYRKEGKFTLAGDFFTANDLGNTARGLTGFGTLNLSTLHNSAYLAHWDLIARFDWLDNNSSSASSGTQDLLILGAAYRWNKYFQTLLNYEQNRYPGLKNADGTDKDPDGRLMLQAEVKY